MSATSRRGFTLVELMAALTLTGFALLGAWQLLGQLADGRDRVAVTGDRDTRQRNGFRFLRTIVYRADVGVDSTKRFSGSATELRFQSWCDAPGGWLERCDVVLIAATERDSSTVSARLAGAGPLTLWRGTGAVSFCYLERDRLPLRAWESSISLPAAIGIVLEGDTLVLPIGVGR